jgi:hypothetical protein
MQSIVVEKIGFFTYDPEILINYIFIGFVEKTDECILDVYVELLIFFFLSWCARFHVVTQYFWEVFMILLNVFRYVVYSLTLHYCIFLR